MNILFVTDSLNVGGAQTFLMRLANELALQHKILFYIIWPQSRDKKFERSLLKGSNTKIIDSIQISSAQHRLIGRIGNLLYRFGYKTFRNDLTNWIYRRDFQKVILKENIDIINSHLFTSDLRVYRCLGNRNIPWVISMHGCYETFLHGGYSEKFKPGLIHSDFIIKATMILRKSSGTILVSDKNKEIFNHLNKNLIKRILYEKIYIGFKPESFIPKKRIDHSIDDKSLIFGMVARGIEDKGWKYLIQAFLELIREGFSAQLVLVSNITEHIKQLSIDYSHKNIIFTGLSYNPMEWISLMDVSILPSYFPGESLPNSIIEYLCEAKPVIATDIGDIKQMITHEGETAGFLIPLKENRPDRDALKNALRTYLLNPELISTHSAIAKKAFSKFSMESCVESYLNFFNKVSYDTGNRIDACL